MFRLGGTPQPFILHEKRSNRGTKHFRDPDSMMCTSQTNSCCCRASMRSKKTVGWTLLLPFHRVLLDVHHISSWAFLATVPKVYWIPQEAWIGWAPQSQVESVVLRSVGMWCLQCWQQRIIPGGSLRQDAVSLTRVFNTTDHLLRNGFGPSFRLRVSGLFVHGPSGYLWKTKRERFQISFIFWKASHFKWHV